MDLVDSLLNLFHIGEAGICCCPAEKTQAFGTYSAGRADNASSRWEGITSMKNGKPTRKKQRRRHASLIEKYGVIISEPLPGWTPEQFKELILALRDTPDVCMTRSMSKEDAHWNRMRLVAQRVPGKTARQCSECASYIAAGGIAYYATPHGKAR